jgi:bifunctional polynucleotide phosphatase/kinase
VFNQLDFPISIYAATEKDIFRKPRIGMWTELLDDCDISPGDLDLPNSIFVGDAGGRLASGGKPKDFSCSDRYSLLPYFAPILGARHWPCCTCTDDTHRNFAANVGITFHTPEEYFLGEAPRPFETTFDPSKYVLGNAIAEGQSKQSRFWIIW